MVRSDSARTASPENAEAHGRYATLASYFSLHAEAVQAWERALELEPGDAAGREGYIHDLRWAGIFETDRRYGRHLLREDRLPEALDLFVEATAFRGWYRAAAAETAEAIGLSEEVVEERLAVRRPAVERELELRELGQRMEREAPEFAIADQTGVEWRLSDLEGKVVVLKFWATWCGPCIEEFPHFVELLKTYEDDDDVVFLTVATAGSPREEVAEQIEEGGFTFPVLFDEQGLALDYEILGYPTTLYLDQAGFIQFKREGFVESGYEEGVARRIDALRSQ